MGRISTLKRNYDNEGNLISKECSCCHKIKSVSEFHKCKNKIDGLRSECKECRKKYAQENKDKIKQYREQYNIDNAEKIKEYEKQRRKDNAEYYKEYHKQYQKDNAEKIKEYKKEYYKDNVDSLKEYHKQYRKDNAERIKKYYKQYQKDNAESIKERQKEYYKDNVESLKEREKQYRKDNAERIKEHKKEYKAKKIQESLQQIKTEVENNPDKYNYIEGKEIFGIIYLVHNIKSNKYYVGQTTVGFDNRYPSGWLCRHGYKNTVKHDLELYGENSFEYVKLFKVGYSQYELDKLEAYYIDYYNSYENGYNENRGNIFTDRGKEK